jgi:TetR/AcrR family transcriptional regulator
VTRQALRRENRINAILESAVAAFRRHGYHGTTMEQIAESLLMTKGSLYYYFHNKEEILFAVHDQALDRILAELSRVKKTKSCACDQLEDLIAAHIRIMVEGFHGTALALEFGALSPRRLSRIVAKRDRYEHALRNLIDEGGRQGCFRKLDPKMAGLALLGAINWIAKWYHPDGPAGAKDVAGHFLGIVMGGMLPRGAAWEKNHQRYRYTVERAAPTSGAAEPARRQA